MATLLQPPTLRQATICFQEILPTMLQIRLATQVIVPTLLRTLLQLQVILFLEGIIPRQLLHSISQTQEREIRETQETQEILETQGTLEILEIRVIQEAIPCSETTNHPLQEQQANNRQETSSTPTPQPSSLRPSPANPQERAKAAIFSTRILQPPATEANPKTALSVSHVLYSVI